MPPVEPPTLENPFDLTPKELLFVEAYCGVANFCAIKAYEVAGYSMRGIQSTRYANAVKVLGKPKIQQAIETKLAARIRRVRVMDGDEALERLTLYARADIGKVLAPEDPLAKLPDDVRLTIKAVRPNQFGRVIELYDSMKATELLAKAAGKLTEHHEHKHTHTLEDIVAGASSQDGAAA